MKKLLVKKFVLAAFCLLVLPATAFADGIVTGPCGGGNIVGDDHPTFGPCGLFSAGSATYGAQAISGENNFRNNHSPVVVSGFSGQVNVFVMTIVSNPVWTVPGPVPTRLALEGTITILEPGASVNLIFTGLLGGPPLTLPAAFLVNHTFSVELFGDQAIASAAVSTLVITINGAASFT